MLLGRIRNLLFGFSSESIVSCERKSWIFSKEWIPILLFFKERRERIAHSRSFVKSDESKMLPLLFIKEQWGKEQQELFALGHKKRENSENYQKHDENYKFFFVNHSFFWEQKSKSRSNHSCYSFLISGKSDSLLSFFVKSNKSNWLMIALL